MSDITKKTKVCYVLSYKSPTYVRTRVLLSALEQNKSIVTYEAINSRTSVLRYAETIGKTLISRVTKKPDVYLLGFRGHEIYWSVRLITFPKPIIFDEFINVDDWLVEENKKIHPKSILRKIAKTYVRSILRSANTILTDTKLDAASSSETYRIPIQKYKTVYVGTDEQVFVEQGERERNKNLNVFFYGNMAPLHGAKYILDAAKNVRDQPITFQIVGGRGKTDEVSEIKSYVNEHKLTNVRYQDWVLFEDLPKFIKEADVCLGGPFGNTSQAKRVITGKTYQFLASAKPTVVGKIDEGVGFKDKINCFFVEQGSAESLAETLEWALKNRSKLGEIGKNGRKLFEANFSTKLISQTLEEVIESV